MFGKKKMYELECRIEELTRKNDNLVLHIKAIEDNLNRTGERLEMFDKAICDLNGQICSSPDMAIQSINERLMSIEDDVNHLVANESKTTSKTTKKATKKSDA